MPKNKIGGKGAKKAKNQMTETRTLILKDATNLQHYAYVIKILGDSRVSAMCDDGQERICIIRGTMKKKVWISAGDLILISLRASTMNQKVYDNDKADIIHKYDKSEIKTLGKLGENVNFIETQDPNEIENSIQYISDDDSDDDIGSGHNIDVDEL